MEVIIKISGPPIYNEEEEVSSSSKSKKETVILQSDEEKEPEVGSGDREPDTPNYGKGIEY